MMIPTAATAQQHAGECGTPAEMNEDEDEVEVDIPHPFRCPISGELLVDPVVAADGEGATVSSQPHPCSLSPPLLFASRHGYLPPTPTSQC
jgi:hypothetical protein